MASTAIAATGTTTGTAAAATAASAATVAASGATLNRSFGDFLSLLTTQLRNQDPLSPLDTNQFTSQLVQFAGVEQALMTNQHLDTLIGLEQGAQLAQLGAFLGRRIEAATDQLPLQEGSATLAYTATGGAEAVRILIRDANGRIVRDTTGPATAGRQVYSWDGRDNSGRRLADGAYAVSVSELRTGRDPQPLATTVIGLATGADGSGTAPQLALGAVRVPLGAVRAVLAPAG